MQATLLFMTRQRFFPFICVLVVASLLPLSVYAQDNLPRRSQNYMRDTISLAASLGGAHAARVTCNGRSDQFWRKYMQELLSLEAPNRDALHRAMVDAFNNAFSRERALHAVCDQDAIQAEGIHAATGRRLSDRLAEHYFPRQGGARITGTIDPG